jgi:hypothetical protein
MISFLPNFCARGPSKAFQNHQLTTVSVGLTISYGPQFKLSFRIPIFDCGCLGLGPATEGDQTS